MYRRNVDLPTSFPPQAITIGDLERMLSRIMNSLEKFGNIVMKHNF